MNKKIIFAATLLAVLVASMVTIPLAYADASGSRSGTTFAGNIASTGGSIDWSNASNAASSNNAYATATITSSSSVTNYLRATGFGFTLPATAIVQGIQVDIERSEANTQTSTIFDNVVSLVKNNAVVGQDKGTSTAWPTADAVATYGGASDLWGTTWTASDINNANFGAVLSVGRTSGGNEQARVDQITIIVTYIVPSQEGPTGPTSQVGNIARTGGDVSWTNAGNILASDNNRATATLTTSGDTTNYLRGTGFNFNIPAGSTIQGIQLNIERSENGNGNDEIRDSVVSLVKNNVITGDNKAATTTDWPQPASEATATYGSSSDLWGTTWTVADINNANFGFVLSATITGNQDEQARVDAASITVYYTAPVNTAPTANGQNLNTNEDTSLPITLTGNANDAGQTLTFAIVSNPSHGTLSGFDSATGAVTYNPTANYGGPDSFTFRVNDGFANSTDATVSITVNAVNDAPAASGQNVNTNEDSAVPITLTATDIEGNTLTWTITDDADHGVLSGTAPNLTYTPATNYFGTDSFQFKVNDGAADSNTATVSITVNAVNDEPVLNTIATPQTVNELAALTFNATATDPDASDTLIFGLSGAPAGAAISPSGAFSWTPTEAQGPGEYTFDVVVSDGTLSDSQTVTVNVDEVNELPTLNAIGDQTVAEGDSVSIPTGASDSDEPANALTYSAQGLPAWASIDTSTGEISGVPGESDDGTSEVTLTVEDGQGGSDSETFDLTVTEVNTPPELAAIGDRTVDELSALSFTASATDADLPANVLTFSLGGTVPSGASITPDGEFTFTPDESQGPTSYAFDVVVSDGSASDSETIAVTVNEVNAAPELAAIGDQTINELSTLLFTAAAVDADEPANSITFSLSGEPAGAEITSAGDFSWTPSESQGPGNYTFAVIVSDGGATDSEAITVTVSEVNVPPVLGEIGNQNVNEGSPLAFTATATDGDEPANTLAFSLSGEPAGASITADGQFTFTPTESQGPGDYAFDVIVSDGEQTDSETITVTVGEVNQDPVLNAIGDQTIAENVPVSIATGASDADLPANTLTYGAEGLPAWASIDTATGEITGTPSESDDGTSAVTVNVEDANGGSDSETFNLTVTEVNAAPVLGSVGDQTVNEESLLAFTATATDSDLPTNTLSFSLVNEPAGASITSTGDFSWTPTETQGPGEYIFDVVVSDGSETDSETIIVTVNEVNTEPQIDSIGDQSVDELSTLSLTATATDSDLPANSITFSLSGEPAGAAITPTGEFTFTPTESQGPGNYTFDIIVSDGATTDTETITVTVNEVNTNPTLNAIGDQTVAEGDSVSIQTGATDVDEPANTLIYEAAGLPAWASIDATTGEITGIPTESDQGASSVTVSVQDGQGGSDSETFNLAVTEINSAPALDAMDNQTTNELATLSFAATATDADVPADILVFSLSGEPSGAAITPDGNFTWAPTEAQGPSVYTFDIVVSDGTVTHSETISVTVTEVNSDPQLTNPGTHTFNEGSPVSIPMIATDGDEPANTLTFAATGLPSWASIDAATGEITGTPGEDDDGTLSVEVTVLDGQGGSDSETFDLTVTEENSAPVLEAIGEQNVDEGSLLAFTVNATDADAPGQTLTFGLENAPDGAAITPEGAFTWTPAEDQGPGSYAFNVTVSDSLVSDFETIVVTVNEVNVAPELGSIGHKFVDELSQLSFTATAVDTDIPANSLSYSLSGPAPSGASITPEGLFAWTPTEAQGPGEYTFDVVVSDGSTTDTESVTVTVAEVDNTDNTRPNIAITSPPNGHSATAPSSPLTLSLEGTASDAESGIAEVMVRTDSASYHMATPASPGNWTTWSSDVTFLTSGSHQIVARATDNAGNTRWFIVNVNTELETDTTKPMVTITNPTNGDTLTGPSSGVNVLIQGTAFDGQSGVQLIEVRTQNSAYQPATPVSPGDWSSWSFGKVFATAGSYQIVAKVTDNAGNTQWHIVNVQIDGPDTVRPTLTVTTPVDGQTISGPSSGVTVHLEGAASDLSGVQIVESRTESTIYQPASPTSPGDWSAWSRDVTFATDGPHQLVVRATDSAGNMQWVVVNVNIEFTS